MSEYDDLPLVLRPTTLSPLPPNLRNGLIAVAFFGILSLATSATLFIYLTAKLTNWYRKRLVESVYDFNQFLLLIVNLLLADIQQACAFALTAVYLAEDKIEVGTTTCWANGWFVSTGDLASGIWIFTIALHTFFTVVKGRSIPSRVFYPWIVFNWAVVFGLALGTVIPHENVYQRASSWCWISREYESQRLWLHYFWIFVFMGGTVITYFVIFISMWNRSKSFGQASYDSRGTNPANYRRALKYMAFYPVVYVVFTLPLAAGRMRAMTGARVSFEYYCFAGAAITSNGWLDVLLYVMTRRVLIFTREPPRREDFGFDTLGFKASGAPGFFGTTTVIEGGKYGAPEPRDIWGRRKARTVQNRHSDEDFFANPPADNTIATKTTVEVSTGPMPPQYADSDFISVIEMDDRPPRTLTPTRANSKWPESDTEEQSRKS